MRLRAALLASTALVASSVAQAADDTWKGTATVPGLPGYFDFQAPANWVGGVVPSVGDTAFFGATTTPNISSTGLATVGGFTFDNAAPVYNFKFDSLVSFNGAGIINNGAGVNIVAAGLNFTNSASAGNANIITAPGSITTFDMFSTAANATITNHGAIRFLVAADGGNAAITNVGSGAVVDFSYRPAPFGTMQASLGSLAGEGNLYLGATALAVGSNNRSTTFSGLISDCGAGGTACVDSGAAGGSLLKTGTGTLTLTGTGSRLGGGFAIEEGAVVMNGGSLTVDGGTSLSGGSLVIKNGAVLNSQSDFVTISQQTSGASTPTVPEVLVTGTGSRWNINAEPGIGYFPGTPGAGVLTIADGGTVAVAAGRPLGLSNVGTLKIGTGGLAGTIVADLINNGGQIIANFTDTSTIAGTIYGTGTLQKLGPGTLVLDAFQSTYTGATTVDGGTLVVNSRIFTSAFTVNSGGTLGGSGMIGPTTIMSGGTLSPSFGIGNRIGVMSIDGLTFAAGSNYVVDISPTDADYVFANGNLVLDGKITAVGTGYGYKIGSRHEVLHGILGKSGTFSSFETSGSFGSAKPRLEYGLKSVFIDFDANSLALTGLTPNQTVVANTINTALQQGIQLAAFDVAFNAPNGLDLLSGEVHASTLGLLANESGYARNAVLGRLRQASFGGNTQMASLATGGPQAFATDGTAFDSTLAFAKSPIVRKAPMLAPKPQSDVVFWAQGFGAWGKFDADGNAASVRRDLAGFVTGFDTRAGEAGRIGIAAGYTGSKNNADGRGSANVDTAHIAAYGGWNFGALNLRAGGAFAHHSINTDRTIALPGFFDRAFSSYAGYTGQVFGEAGYGFNMQGVALEAFAGAAWVRVHANGTTERGGDAALNVAASSFEVGYSTLGLRAATIVPLANSMILVPRVTVAWQHAFGSTTPGVVNAFAALPAMPFAIQGAPIARDSFLTEVGADVAITPQMTLGVSYTGQIARNVSDHGAKGKFSYRF